MGVPYTFGTATTSIPLSQLDANFNTPVTLGNTTVGLGNTATTIGNLTLTNVTITSGTINAAVVDSGYVANSVVYADSTGVLTAGSANLTFNGTTLTTTGLSNSGNLTFTGTGNRITGDFSNATIANRVLFQNSVTNASSTIQAIPNGTAVVAGFLGFNNSDPTNASFIQISTPGGIEARLTSGITGTGTYLPLTMYTGGSERLRIDTSGNVGIGTSSPTFAAGTGLQVKGSGFTSVRVSAGSYTGLDISQTSTNGTSYVYLRDNAPLIFGTNDTEQMRIAANGNVGIGTSSPAYQLQIGTGGTDVSIGGAPTANGTGRLKFINSNTNKNWQISTNDTVGGAFEIIQSTAAGGSTFTTPVMLIDSSGNVGIGITAANYSGYRTLALNGSSTGSQIDFYGASTHQGYIYTSSTAAGLGTIISTPFIFSTNNAERMRITSDGVVLIGKTADNNTTQGVRIDGAVGFGGFIRSGGTPLLVNRLTNDGTLVEFSQDSVVEGTISVSGNTVSYNGGHLSRWSQLPNNSKDDKILKGTVLTNLDDMCVWTKDGKVLPNEQLNKMKVSDVEGDTNVAGVFVNWTFDEQCQSDDMNVAMTGDMIIRIAKGVVVQKGDLLMSAGDGTAKPQGDDIRRSKTVAKVTSNHVTCTYADGSYCVPCVLMAC